jgi:hypothetical protein
MRRLVVIVAMLAAAAVIVVAVRAALDWREKRAMDERVDAIIMATNIPPSSDFRHRVDAVRTFINDHSQDKIDAAFRAMDGDGAAFSDGILAHAHDPSIERVHMECSTRANLMGRVLRRMGYETRTIALFKTKGKYSSHTFLDVLNPATGRWETQDPDYDLYWISNSSHDRVSLAEAAENLDDLIPCGRESCSWAHVSREGNAAKSIIDKLDILSVTSKEHDVRYSVYTTRADRKQTFDIHGAIGTYCEVMAKRCRDGFRPVGQAASAK